MSSDPSSRRCIKTFLVLRLYKMSQNSEVKPLRDPARIPACPKMPCSLDFSLNDRKVGPLSVPTSQTVWRFLLILFFLKNLFWLHPLVSVLKNQ